MLNCLLHGVAIWQLLIYPQFFLVGNNNNKKKPYYFPM